MNADLSIVVIAYNDESHISNAIESLLNQSMQNIEIICVDDCSEDRTFEIMEEYSESDSRIKAIKLKKNSGAFGARYKGIMSAKGKYIMFLDSDDYYEKNACETANKSIVKNKADVLQFGANIFSTVKYEDIGAYNYTVNFLTNYLDSSIQIPNFHKKADLLNYAFVHEKLPWNVWNKIYSLNLVKKALSHYKSEHITYSEDALFSFMIFLYCKKIVRIKDKLYNYAIGEGISTSESRRKISSKKDMLNKASSYLAYSLVLDWLKKDEYPIAEIQKSLDEVKKRIMNDICNSFMFNCQESRVADFYNIICEFCPREEFLENLIRYTFDDNKLDDIKLIDRLLKCDIKKDPKNIKNVALFYHRLSNGGVERVISLLAPLIKRIGYKVFVITEDSENELDYKLPKSIKRIVIGESFNSNVERYRKLKQVIRENNINAVIYNSWVGLNYCADSIAIRSENCKLILYVHSNSALSFSSNYFYSNNFHLQHKMYGLVDSVVTLTSKDYEWWKLLNYQVYLVPNPLTFDINNLSVSKLDNNNVVWIGRMSEEKQFFEVIKIAKFVKKFNQAIKFTVVGKPENSAEWAYIKKEVKKENLQDTVSFVGYSQNVGEYIKNSFVYLSTSKVEGFSMTLIEAKAYGVPAVLYYLSNLDFLSKENGVVTVQQQDSIAAAQEIIKIYSDESYRKELGNNARNSIKEYGFDELESMWKKIITGEIVNKKIDLFKQNEAVKEVLDYLQPNSFAQNSTSGVDNANSYVLSKELLLIKRSKPWKVGRLLTYVPRLALDFIKFSKAQGIKSAFKWLGLKIKNLGTTVSNFFANK